MKLQKFDATNSKSVRTGEPTINFNRGGCINLSKTFGVEANLKEGMKVSICQDEDEPADWYLIVNDPDGFELRRNTGDNLTFNAAFITKSFIEAMQFNTNIVNCKMSTDIASTNGELPKGCKAYAIITTSAKYKEIETED